MDVSRRFGDGESLTDLTPLAWVSRPASTPGALAVCPFFCRMTGLVDAGLVDHLYRLAHEQAVATTRPPRHEQLLMASSN